MVGLALAPAARLAWKSRDMPHFGHLHDDSIYFVCAKSLATGAGYRILSLPGRPYQTKYPPLLPALLSVIWRIDPRFPENLQLTMLAMWALLPVYLLLSARWFRDAGFSDWGCAVVCGLIALSPSLMFYSMTVMSDLLFSCFLLAALLLAERAGNAASRAWLAPAAGVFATMAYLTKAAALPLIVTVPLLLMLRGQRRRALWFALTMAPAIVVWTGWVHAHRAAATDLTTIYYTDYFGFQLLNVGPRDLPFLIWKNLDSLFSGIAGLIIFDDGKSAGGVYLARFLALGAILGAVRLGLRRGFTQYHAFAAVYLGMLLVWHYPPNERFVIPVFPLLAAGFASEICLIAGLVKRARAGPIAPLRAVSRWRSWHSQAGVYFSTFGRSRKPYLPFCARIARCWRATAWLSTGFGATRQRERFPPMTTRYFFSIPDGPRSVSGSRPCHSITGSGSPSCGRSTRWPISRASGDWNIYFLPRRIFTGNWETVNATR